MSGVGGIAIGTFFHDFSVPVSPVAGRWLWPATLVVRLRCAAWRRRVAAALFISISFLAWTYPMSL